MTDQIYTTTSIDENGRQLVLSDQIKCVQYYDASSESWDKTGSAGQTWYTEKFLPNDAFDSTTFLSDRWGTIDTPESSDSTLNQSDGKANFGVERDEGIVGLTSNGKWVLSGDFEIRLYIDWNSYYNEYRSFTYSFLKVAKDNSNAARISFSFDGVSEFKFSSEKTVGRSLTFFDWRKNGAALGLEDFEEAEDYLFLKISRVSGQITTYISDGSTDTQVGETITDSVFASDLYVELGVETKEYNTYRHSFTKFFVNGAVLPLQEFFSPHRGVDQAFPDRSMIVVDDLAASIIDFDKRTLWLRFLFGEENTIADSSTKVRACNGSLYFTGEDGLIVFDFHRDKIFKYSGNSIKVALDPISLRNSSQFYKTHISNTGTLLSDTINDVACKSISGVDYFAVATEEGVSVKRALASGIYNNTQGNLPVNIVQFSDKGALYWAGYDLESNLGDLSSFSNVGLLTSSGTQTFNRTTFYSTSTQVGFYGENVQAFDVRTVNNTDLLAVGTNEGISFLGFSPGTDFTGSISYGVDTVEFNPITDPSFENYLGLVWRTTCSGLHKTFLVSREDSFGSPGDFSLRLKFDDLPTGAYHPVGTYLTTYQDVDLTGVQALYFDMKMVGNGTTNVWDFQIVVDGDVLKSYRDTDAPFTKFSDSVNTAAYTGVQRVEFRVVFVQKVVQTSTLNISGREVYIDNVRTFLTTPDYRILPSGNASIIELLLQYDDQGHKVYFASQGGYGAVDLDDNSLDYFTSIEVRLPDADVLSADFSRVEDGD